MTLLYGRQVKLIVGDSQSAYDLSQLRVQFNVYSATVSTLKYAQITIWNLGKEKANEILKEFTRITLSAGYEGLFGQIFDGQIARVESGKYESNVDSFVKILAQDGDDSKNWTMTNATLSAGWTDEDIYNQLITDFQKAGLQKGFRPGLNVTVAGARGITMVGKTADFMDQLANRQGFNWFIEDNQVIMVSEDEPLPGGQQVLSSLSGLIGIPKLTINGVTVKCLLNPNLRTGCQFQIDNSAIAQLNQQTPPFNDPGSVIPTTQGQPDGTGIYKAHCVSHTGDTRGNEWYTELIGVSIDSTGPNVGPALYDIPAEV